MDKTAAEQPKGNCVFVGSATNGTAWRAESDIVPVTRSVARKIEEEGAQLVHVRGVSMEPTLLHGDTVLVEQKPHENGSIVAVSQEGRVFGRCKQMVARARLIGGELWLVKDNTEEYGDYSERLSEFKVEGVVTKVLNRDMDAQEIRAEAAKVRRAKRQAQQQGEDYFRTFELIDCARSQEIPIGARIRFRADGLEGLAEGILTKRTRNGFYTLRLDSGDSVTYRNMATFITLGSVWRYDESRRLRSGSVVRHEAVSQATSPCGEVNP